MLLILSWNVGDKICNSVQAGKTFSDVIVEVGDKICNICLLAILIDIFE